MDLKKTSAILKEVADERIRQEDKFGQQNHDPYKYLTILGEEFGEASQAALKANKDGAGGANDWDVEKLESYRGEFIQTAAVAVAAIECLDRNQWCNFGCGLKGMPRDPR